MFKILIADDEQIVLDSLTYIIEKNFKNVIISGTARSGREAIEKAESVIPDIIFMDIKMPGINGIDAIREIKGKYKHVIFIILTAFEQFDFAKEAVNLGVIEYLLKPVNRVKVIETVKKVVEIISTEREKRNKELELKEKLESVLPVLENGFIYSIVFFDDNSRELENYRQIFGIAENGGYIMTVEFGEAESRGSFTNKIGLSVKSQNFYPFFRETIKGRCKCIVGPVMLNRVIVFIPSDVEDDEYNQRLEAVNIAEAVLDKLPERLDADFCIGIGKSYRSFENLSRSYEESLKAIRYAGNRGIMHFMDIPTEVVANSEYPIYKEKILMEKASLGDTGACLDAFNYIFNWLIAENANQTLKTKSKLLELTFLIQRLAWEYSIDDSGIQNRKDYLEEMLVIEDISELKAWCREKIEHITNQININREKRIGNLTLKAKEYIDNRYNKEITLEDVSREVNVSPHYFSKLFKEETGKNFIDYLTDVRIRRAKEFLESGQYSIKEICYKVGYGDPNYFSRIFKKNVGVTPTDYKESIQNGRTFI